MDPINKVNEAASIGSSESQLQSDYNTAVLKMPSPQPDSRDFVAEIEEPYMGPSTPMAEVNVAASIASSESHSQSQPMDPSLYDAAAKGDFQPFVGKDPHDLKLIVTHFKDTILHIHIKFQYGRRSASTQFVEKILEKSPSLLFETNTKGDTPLHVAAKGGCSLIVEVLIQRAKPQRNVPESMLRIKNNEHNTALHEAVIHFRCEVVEILTEADRDFPYFANKYGQTPLYLAAAQGDVRMVKAMLGDRSLAAHGGPNGKTALHAAVLCPIDYPFAINSFASVMKYILDKKNLTTVIDQYGWTPLHYAAYNGKYFAAKLLLEKDRSVVYSVDEDHRS